MAITVAYMAVTLQYSQQRHRHGKSICFMAYIFSYGLIDLPGPYLSNEVKKSILRGGSDD